MNVTEIKLLLSITTVNLLLNVVKLLILLLKACFIQIKDSNMGKYLFKLKLTPLNLNKVKYPLRTI